ncbi:MAG: HugZ family protein [Sideroxydans sp.]
MISEHISSARAARLLLRAHRYGALCTLSQKFDGHPFGSITPYLTDHDGSLLLFVSGLAEHTRNMLADSRVSLISHNQDDARIETQGRVTVLGHAVHDAARSDCAARYLRYFPEAERYLALADFNFFRITPSAIRYIGGFGDIHWVKPEHYRIAAADWAREEQALLEEFNGDEGKWLARFGQHPRMVGVDCDGFDIRAGGRLQRHPFTVQATDAAHARSMLLTAIL